MRSLPFLLREAFTNLKRHGLMTMAAITTIALSLALLGGFLLTFYQVSTAATRILNDFEMRVFCRPEIKKEEIAPLRARIQQLDGVLAVSYLSKEQIWKEQTQNSPIDLEGIPNLMNDTFVVKLADPDQASQIAGVLRGWHKEIEHVSVPEQEMDRVLRLAGFVKNAGMVGAIVLLVGALVVVSNTIRISVFARRREIKIMQLVGAAPWFIRLPLLIEGLLHGLAGGALAGLSLFSITHYLSGLIQESAAFLLPYAGTVDLPRCVLALILLGALIGAGGSLVSIHRYLRAV